jgi:predicted alpha/beta hydrolase family esterase
MKVILMHGKDATPEDKWYPWFKTACEREGWKFTAPVLPKSADPVLKEWVDELENCKPDEETVLVGHSRGGVAVLRFLEQMNVDEKVKAVILVATNDGRRSHKAIPTETNYGFYTEAGYNFDEIKSHSDNFFVLHSTDDHVVPYQAGVENAAGLGVELMSFSDRRHFGSKGDGTCVTEIPELIEIISRL